MVAVEINVSGGKAVGFTAKGHAEYADPGEDIVCSAVSALTQTTLLGLLEEIEIKTEYVIDDDGYIDCMIADTSDCEKCKQADLIIRVMKLGLCNIKENYSKYLGITEREVTI